jgi:hypothetical protein
MSIHCILYLHLKLHPLSSSTTYQLACLHHEEGVEDGEDLHIEEYVGGGSS